MDRDRFEFRAPWTAKRLAAGLSALTGRPAELSTTWYDDATRYWIGSNYIRHAAGHPIEVYPDNDPDIAAVLRAWQNTK